MKTKFVVGSSIAVTLVAAFLYLNRGVTVTVNNVGSDPLRSVVIQATGYSHSLGHIDAGQSKRTSVSASGESHIEVEHAGGPRLVVNCYFESGYRGNISVDVSDNRIVKKECAVRPGVL
jgi:hypothetical protein